ncbi:MAG: type II secretion system GspH family protein [Planctomycetaceae bacterium]|jgi:prepilin-type N-terminal cleavage/methylation domain-containing protein|nr:type II secretion system GspH family protein [Planctomycetaceae bacterium]
MFRKKAFTLIEIMVVLVILAAVAALGIPMLMGTLDQHRLRFAADQFRGECLETKVKGMEDGQIFCLRCQLGTSTLVLDRVLDAHFTAGLSSRQTTSRFDSADIFDPFEQGGFTGSSEDFRLRNPAQPPDTTNTEGNTRYIKLPEDIVIVDVITAAEERAAFYLGLTAPGESETEESTFAAEDIMLGELRLGETADAGTVWSAPIFFYPDGTTSTAAVLLRNKSGRCLEVRLRGLTGTCQITEIQFAEKYTGELNSSRY